MLYKTNRKPSKKYNLLKNKRRFYNMRHRCNNPNDPSYHRYGGRGIRVCERWDSFKNFHEDMGDCPDGMSLDRIDNDGDYSPENCRWATNKQQARNMSTNRMIAIDGQTKCLAEWCEQFKLDYSDVCFSLMRGSSVNQALGLVS